MSPYPEQIAAAEAAVKYERGVIVAPTGCGKSLIVALIIDKLKVPTLVVVPSLELKKQLTATLKELFGYCNAGELKDNLFIAVENVDALDHNKVLDYDCVIIDEFHHSAAETYQKLNKHSWHGVYYKFGLTATAFRSNENERLLLESVLSQVIYRIGYHTAVEQEYIVPLEAYYIELPKRPIEGNEFNWQSMYNELVVSNISRNNLIMKLLHNLQEAGIPTLCLVKEINHGENLQTAGIPPFINGADEESRYLINEFNEGRVKVLIGTTGVLGEGIDTRPCEYVIIAGLGKSKNAFMQNVGRSFRLHPGKESAKVIIFYDKSHKWTRAHFRAQCKYLLDEYAVIPVKIEL